MEIVTITSPWHSAPAGMRYKSVVLNKERLSVRAQNILSRIGVRTTEHLEQLSKQQMAGTIKGCGWVTVREIARWARNEYQIELLD